MKEIGTVCTNCRVIIFFYPPSTIAKGTYVMHTTEDCPNCKPDKYYRGKEE